MVRGPPKLKTVGMTAFSALNVPKYYLGEMKMSTKQTAFRLNDETINYLKQYQQERQLSSLTRTVELIVQEHKDASLKQEEVIAKRVIELFEQKYGNTLTRIRLATRTSDINVQVMMEVLNSILYSGPFSSQFISTDVMKSGLLESAEEKVKARIAYYKQLKDNKTKKGNDVL